MTKQSLYLSLCITLPLVLAGSGCLEQDEFEDYDIEMRSLDDADTPTAGATDPGVDAAPGKADGAGDDSDKIVGSCPADGTPTNGYPGFPTGIVEYSSLDASQCASVKLESFCASWAGGVHFHNQCGCGCVWTGGGME